MGPRRSLAIIVGFIPMMMVVVMVLMTMVMIMLVIMALYVSFAFSTSAYCTHMILLQGA